MNINNIGTKVSKWFQDSGESPQVIISSRIRLARNISNHRFTTHCDYQEKDAIISELREAILQTSIGSLAQYVDIATANQLQKELLIERHLISKNLCKNKGPRGAIISKDEAFTAMLNEEDHLRMQVILPGLKLDQCWEIINRIDTEIENQVKFAFDQRLGYLTACPTNVGTGIRVSLMLHLPALKMTKQIEKLLNATKEMKLAVRGLFGEGTDALGDFFQISNQITLGVREEDIIEKLTQKLIPKIVEYELVAREHLLCHENSLLEDKIYRARGILENAYLINSKEALFLLSNLRLGINLGKIKDIDIATINELFMLTQPAHLQKNAGGNLTPRERDELRAKIIRNRINAQK